jgi:hypothetical protein
VRVDAFYADGDLSLGPEREATIDHWWKLPADAPSGEPEIP